MAAYHVPADHAEPSGNTAGTSGLRPAALANWLLAVAVLVVIMVVIGGITRLTESGLSITEWKPVTGTLPPLSEAAWQAEFAAYRQIGEYRQVTGPAGMTLADYKFIYFWEWAHRFMGRLIGLAFALPLAWFWIRGAIPAGYRPRLVALLALGGLQGVFGWFMVRSGLSVQMTDVSHFWLSIHLLTALFTLAGLVWTALDLRLLAKGRSRASLTDFSAAVGVILFVQLLLGAWVAGLNAGLASDSWPLMQGGFLPEYDGSRGFFHALTHDPFLLHFAHRWWAFAAAIALFLLARRAKAGGARAASVAVNALLGVQILLGIATVLSGVALWLAVAHQMVGALLVAATAWGAHAAGRQRGEAGRYPGAAMPATV
ncbi:COX15/CtaA family protein [Pseudopontixanthobacter vadosimaris]|uniref:COX15/CtaA family protein n=1 Tax=Pseudopontixanthobacter vadosimaris TaxID=2726450 RepID=UPI0014742575|nr:COX15/CtaA family protein [Pseudopontixanthobacter vadosimaris]